MLRRILSATAPTHAAAASFNNHWGVPLTLARLPPDSDFGIVEIGMNHAGEIAPLAQLARPHVAVITAIEAAHIGNLGSLEAIADEKARLLDGLEPGGIAVLPADSPQLPCLRAAAKSATVISFGTSAGAEARLIEAEVEAGGTRLTAAIFGEQVRVSMRASGWHMAMDGVAAIAAAAALNVPAQRAAAALDGFVPVTGRGARRILDLPGGPVVLLDESYNASAVAMRAAFEVLALQPAHRRIAVLGDMLELGGYGTAEHLSLVPSLAVTADLVFACGSEMRRLFDSLPSRLRGGWVANSAALAPIVAAAVQPGDAVLVKGSLGSRMKLVVEALAARAGAV
jgi:UDP-N-acetylmuramoyl-tripeptide--D-alanyl-D-alanine ligase